MKSRILKILQWILMICGAGAILSIIVLFGLVVYQFEWGNKPEKDKATAQDVSVIISNCHLGSHSVEKVMKSYVSDRSFTGDHVDAYAIKISPVEISELKEKKQEGMVSWYRGDQLPEVLEEAVKAVDWYNNEIPWFPNAAVLKSADYYVLPRWISLGGLHPYAAAIYFFHPADNTIYFFDFKT